MLFDQSLGDSSDYRTGFHAVGLQRSRGGYRADTAQRSFARGSHGTTVEHVVAQVEAMIEPRNDQIRFATQHAVLSVQRNVNTIGRRTVDCENSRLGLPKAQRTIQAYRMARSALLCRRSTHDHIRKVRQGITEVSQSRRSEEHTSELQSRENLVCGLRLEK